MQLASRYALSAVALVALSLGGVSIARADSAARSVITVDDMHCSACARKIARKLYAVPGVVLVETDVKADRARVTPQKGRQPSPRALWEAVKKAGFKPIKLEGPAGVFTGEPPA